MAWRSCTAGCSRIDCSWAQGWQWLSAGVWVPLHICIGHAQGASLRPCLPAVLVVALVSAIGGMLFGFDVGIVSGVSAMASFQKMFFPEIYERNISSAVEDPCEAMHAAAAATPPPPPRRCCC